MIEIFEKYLKSQKEINMLKEELSEKYNIDLSGTIIVEDKRSVNWMIIDYDDGYLDIYKDHHEYDNKIISEHKSLVNIKKEKDLIVILFKGCCSDEGSDIYSLPRCILLSKSKQIVEK